MISDTTTLSNITTGCSCSACCSANTTPQHIGEDALGTGSFVTNGPDGLESGYAWNNNQTGINLKYNFWDARPSYYSASDEEAKDFKSFTAPLKEATVKALDMIESFTKITFTETSSQNSTDIGFAQAALPSNTGAWAYLPTGGDKAGDVWTNTKHVSETRLDEGGYDFFTILHEIGHALGLQHTFSGGLTGVQNTEQYSVMAYNTNTWGSVSAETYQLYDVYALQQLYGANTSYNSGDDVYALQSGKAYTIWDGAGNDTLDGSALTSNLEISLRDGSFSSAGLTDNIAIAYNAIIENAEGGSRHDIIEGNAVNNIINGNDGNDTILGSGGDDILDGGAGNDTVTYQYDISEFLINIADAATVVFQHATMGLDRIFNVENYSFNGTNYALSDLFTFDQGGTANSLITIGARWGSKIYDYESYFSGEANINTQAVGYNSKQFDFLQIDRIDENKLNITLTHKNAPKLLYLEAAASGSEITLSSVVGNSATRFTGNSGDDRLIISDVYANDKIYGFAGNDIISSSFGVDIVFGGLGNDVLNGGDNKDFLFGEEGDDILNGDHGNDRLYGGDDNDTISGGIGADKLYGQDGDDILSGGDHNDLLIGGDGNDILNGDDGNDVLAAGFGNDTINAGSGNDKLYGQDGDDVLNGGTGNDVILGGNGHDSLSGDDGNDVLVGQDGDDTISGGIGADKLYGQNGNDILHGGDDNDKLWGNEGDDLLIGGNGNDLLIGGNGNDILNGDDGNDVLAGQNGDDTISGGIGADKLYGQNGNDTLIGGLGKDYLQGGRGSDLFVLDTIDEHVDYINDFKFTGRELDTLNVSDLLEGYDSLNDDINNFVQLSAISSKHSTLQINVDGVGDDWQDATQLAGNFRNTSIDDLLIEGRLLADQPI